jgi:O-antigen/teichoic acid export membrane protein
MSRPSYSKGIGYGGLGFAVSLFISLFTSIVLARIYGVVVLGEWALAMAPVAAVATLSSAREQAALVRELAKLEPRAPRITGLFAAVYAFSSGLTLVVSALGFLAVSILYQGVIDHPELLGPVALNLGGYLLFQNLGWNLDMVFTSFRAGRQLFHVRNTQAISFLVIGAGGGLVWKSVWVLVSATVASSLVALIHRFVVIRPFMRTRVEAATIREGFDALPEMLRFGIRVAPGGIFDGISREIGTWVLGAVSTTAAVGAYSRAWQLARRFLDLNARVTEMLFPTLVERRSAGDFRGHDVALIDTVRYSLVGMLLPAAAGGGAATGLMQLFGSGFTSASTALAILLVAPALATVNSIQATGLNAANRPISASAAAGVRLIVTVAASVPLGASYGATGVSIGLVAGFVVATVLSTWQMRGELHSRFFDLWPPRQMPALLLAYGGGYLTSHVVYGAYSNVLGLVAALMAGTAVFIVLFGITGGLGERDRNRLRHLLRSRATWRSRLKRGGRRTSEQHDRATPPNSEAAAAARNED